MPSIAEILSSRIGKNGKSKTYIASELKVSEKTIENYMHGKRQPKPAALAQLSQLLGFDLNELSEQSVPREKTPTPKNPYNDQSPDYIIGKLNGLLAGEQARRNDAERFYDKLLEKLGSNLTDLSEGQTVLYSFVRTLLEYQAAIASRGDAKKEAELLGILNSRLKTYENMPEKRGIVEPLHT